MTNPNEKTCIACCMPIQYQAQKCPHCHSLQTKFALSFAKPYLPLLILFFFVVLFGGMIYDIYSNIIREEDTFSSYEKSITVLDSKIHFKEEKDCCSYITTVGHLKNKSDIPWKDISIEVQYFNSSENLVDTVTSKNYSLVLPPNSEATFRVRGKSAREEKEYVKHKVLVRWAKRVD